MRRTSCARSLEVCCPAVPAALRLILIVDRYEARQRTEVPRLQHSVQGANDAIFEAQDLRVGAWPRLFRRCHGLRLQRSASTHRCEARAPTEPPRRSQRQSSADAPMTPHKRPGWRRHRQGRRHRHGRIRACAVHSKAALATNAARHWHQQRWLCFYVLLPWLLGLLQRSSERRRNARRVAMAIHGAARAGDRNIMRTKQKGTRRTRPLCTCARLLTITDGHCDCSRGPGCTGGGGHCRRPPGHERNGANESAPQCAPRAPCALQEPTGPIGDSALAVVGAAGRWVPRGSSHRCCEVGVRRLPPGRGRLAPKSSHRPIPAAAAATAANAHGEAVKGSEPKTPPIV
mmetsp:Transcript_152953/g.388634  ORF Transcript_152953/g.388634 Transcript_152953/m.388634 type:complete len:345 (-) Transcript_152953:78-1112(-)